MNIIRKNIIEISPELKTQINDFIEQNEGLVFHATSINEIASNFFKHELSYFLAYENEKLIAVCPVTSKKTGLLTQSHSSNGSFEILYGGWVFDKAKTNAEKLYSQKKQGVLESLSFSPSFLGLGSAQKGDEDTPYMTGIIDLSLSKDEIWTSYVSSKRRNMIRKAEKSGVEIKNFGVEGLPVYFELNKVMREKVGIKINPIEFYYDLLKPLFPNRALISIAYTENIPVSGLILIGNKNVMHYWQGASLSNNNLGQGELLQWNAIQWAKEQGSKYYDLGIIEPKRLPSIAQFKMGFTKNFVQLEAVLHRKLIFKVINKLSKVFRAKEG